VGSAVLGFGDSGGSEARWAFVGDAESSFEGDAGRAKQTYQGLKALDAEDIAEVVRYCLSLPQHVCINELVITPTAQANPFYINK